MAKDETIFILNGPNLNLLGQREPEIYGHQTLEDIEQLCSAKAASHGRKVDFRQSNAEGDLVDWVQEADEDAVGLIFNPAAYCHTSIALLDALRAVKVPVIEVHLSNIAAREPFRAHSYTASASRGLISGLGAEGYVIALDAIDRLIEKPTQLQ
ncbi:MAG: type II 3-dehydroquinate dehydratase [Pseudomonadota bacterium]